MRKFHDRFPFVVSIATLAMTQSTFDGIAEWEGREYRPINPYGHTHQNDRGYHRNSIDGVTIVHAQDIESFPVKVLKPESQNKRRKATGQYSYATDLCQKYEYFIDRDDPTRIYRRDRTSTDHPVLVLEKTQDGWFPCVPMNTSEVNTLKPFIGSAVVDPEAAIAEGRRSIRRTGRNRPSDRLTKHEKQSLEKHQSKASAHKPVKRKKVAIR